MRLVREALAGGEVRASLESAARVYVVAAGKAAAGMLAGYIASGAPHWHRAVAATPAGHPRDISDVSWFVAGHPFPDSASRQAADAAMAMARATTLDDVLVVLLSGGASALLEQPAGALSLDDITETTRRLMTRGTDIHALNLVRRHLSAVKGGRLAAAAPGRVVTLALSDVVGDDVAVIGSGPTAVDRSVPAEAARVLQAAGGPARYPQAVVRHLQRAESPPAPDRLARSRVFVIGRNADARAAAGVAARQLGYAVVEVTTPVVGEARVAAPMLMAQVRAAAARGRPVCVVSGGETTVHVRGAGRGGRNQELALALMPWLPEMAPVAALCVGTDGVDGPTDAAGAVVDAQSLERIVRLGVSPEAALEANDSYSVFTALGDLVRTGATGTNVGDLQIFMLAAPEPGTC